MHKRCCQSGCRALRHMAYLQAVPPKLWHRCVVQTLETARAWEQVNRIERVQFMFSLQLDTAVNKSSATQSGRTRELVTYTGRVRIVGAFSVWGLGCPNARKNNKRESFKGSHSAATRPKQTRNTYSTAPSVNRNKSK